MSYLAAFFATLSQPDPHALALFRRAGLDPGTSYWPGTSYQVSGRRILRALDELCRGLKATVVDGRDLWSLHSFIYPFVGDTLPAHLCNLMAGVAGGHDGSLENATYALSGQGFRLTDGGSGHINTEFAPGNSLPLASNHLSVYMTTDAPGVQVDIGCGDGGYYFDLLVQLDGSNQDANGTCYFENDQGGMMNCPAPSALGYTTGTRTAEDLASIYKNGQLQATNTGGRNRLYPAVNNVTPINVGIGARRGASFQSGRTFAFASCGLGKTPAQELAVYQLVQRFQTRLNRQIS